MTGVDDPALDWPALHALAGRIVGRYVTATPAAAHLRDDLLSDALLGMVLAVPTWDPARSAATTWLGKRAWWAIIEGQRKRMPVRRAEWARGVRAASDLPADQRPPLSSEQLLEVGLDPGAEDPALAAVADADEAAWLMSALSPRQREIVTRTVLGDDLLREVAEDHGVTESAACRARTKAIEVMARLAATAPPRPIRLDEYAVA